MDTQNDKELQYRRAVERMEAEKGFWNHLFTYAVVISMIWAFNYLMTPKHIWALWPSLGWGIGLGFHALGVFGKGLILGQRWEEKRIKQLMKEE